MKKISFNITAILLLAIMLLCSCTGQGSEGTQGIGSSSRTAEIATSSEAVATPQKSEVSDLLTVHYLDVGQGDSIFIELPNGKAMLIDAAERDMAEKITSYIKDMGYEKLDVIVATHPHSDHIGGMAEVISSFSVGSAYISPATHTTATYERMLEAIENSGCEVFTPYASDMILSEESLTIEVIAPKRNCDLTDLNNSSICIRLCYGENVFIFTGDAEKEEEDGIWTNIKCDVLKLGHHGSSTSTSENFLKKTEPEYAVISCGESNSYGHPHSEVISLLEKNGIEILRTDLLGDIVFVSDGVNVSYVGKSSDNEDNSEPDPAAVYVLNTNTKKIHLRQCSSVSKISQENYAETDDYEGSIELGYTPCGNCNPR